MNHIDRHYTDNGSGLCVILNLLLIVAFLALFSEGDASLGREAITKAVFVSGITRDVARSLPGYTQIVLPSHSGGIANDSVTFQDLHWTEGSLSGDKPIVGKKLAILKQCGKIPANPKQSVKIPAI